MNVGDRVKAIKAVDGKGDLIGKVGTVVVIGGYKVGWIGVDFDNWSSGHNLRNRLLTYSGRWGYEDCFEVIGKHKFKNRVYKIL